MKTRLLRVEVSKGWDSSDQPKIIAIRNALGSMSLSSLSHHFVECRMSHRSMPRHDASDEARALPTAACREIQLHHRRWIDKVRDHPLPGEYQSAWQQHV